ncbi:AcrR family transcriptional regulator [Prauserella sediminis]|uniref:AcrR family transcriptional regulator n=1 Tax=Prauserella sediminis TaxID=577680 RepID=A0A839Y0Y3_9PSEU|nr:TetR/AcrR family transcriptional regulator [Prauserella sediminis]MBB3665605.1 AcrR family transcriptional regulator [Prauserella sediminis]
MALGVFLEKGFDQATVEEIAAGTSMSKRTVYAQYADKSALFVAAVERAVERFTMSREDVEAVITDDLAESLVAVARLRVVNLGTPSAILLQRVLISQSYRFPELYPAATESFMAPVAQVLGDLFERHRSELDISDPWRATVAFLGLAVGGPSRAVVTGRADVLGPELDETIRYAVSLFLDGVRRR